MKKRLLYLLLLVVTSVCYADIDQPLPADQAFTFSTRITNNNDLLAHWKIAPGYHLYYERFKFKVIPENQATPLGEIKQPPGIQKEDDILGKYQVYEDQVTIKIPLLSRQLEKQTVLINYQGCKSSGFCYPEQTRQVTIDYTTSPVSITVTSPPLFTALKTNNDISNQQDVASGILSNKNLLFICFSFFSFGLLLAFTPCVWPMIPILSGIILGQGKNLTTYKAFLLSLIYVLSMAITYAFAGILAGLAGNHLQATLQSPWIIGIFSSFFVILALAMLGYFELRLPARLHTWLTELSNKQQGGNYIGVAVMGFLSSLIVSPCISPPLAGALGYISSTGDAILGGIALLFLGLVMGLPLLIIGVTEGKFLPKAGSWMNAIKAAFGFLLMAVAIDLLDRIIASRMTMVLWAILAIIIAMRMGALTTAVNFREKYQKGFGVLLLLYSITILIGAAQGNTNPLQPLNLMNNHTQATEALPFKPIKNIEDLTRTLKVAANQHKAVMLDFYADWCIACKQMERSTFTQPQIQQALKNFILLRADITANDTDDKLLQQQLQISGPPTLLFFNTQGKEVAASRIIGEIGAAEFLSRIQQVPQ